MSRLKPLCDPQRIESLLQCALSARDEQKLMAHLDECAACRRELESRAAEPLSWDEARRYLARPPLDRKGAPDDDAAENARGRRPLHIQHVLDALAPTDDPQMLGRIGVYEVSGVVGTGGMGVVLRGLDRSLDRTVAIKVLAPHLASNGAARRRFAREAKAAAAVLHPNVMAIHGVSNDESLPYLVMPYVRGASLEKRLHHAGPPPVGETLRIASQIAAGLAAAHAQGLVHRDIKPANILLEEGVERVAITDFGLARAVDDATMTRTGVIAGTPQYMSPEQARGDAVDPRSDLFSLGSVMYTMCTGHPPFRAETSYGILRRITDQEPRAIREINPDVPEWLSAIIEKLMSKRPEDRFQSAAEVAELLADCLAHVQQPEVIPLRNHVPAPQKHGARRRPPARPRLALIALGGLLLLVAGIVIVLRLNQGTLVIRCAADNVPLRITQGDEIVQRLMVHQVGATVRIRSGHYLVEIDGEMDGMTVDNGRVQLRRGQRVVVTIVERAGVEAPSPPPESKGQDRPSAEILAALHDTLERRLKLVVEQYRAGRASVLDVLAADRALAEAEIAGAASPRERLRARQRHVDVLKSFKEMVDKAYKVGQAGLADLLAAEAELLKAEAQLQDDRAGTGDDSTTGH